MNSTELKSFELTYADDLPWRTTEINGRVKILLEEEETTATKPITIIELLSNSAQKYGERPALAYQQNSQSSRNNWISINYQEYENKVKKIANIFIQLGLQCRDIIGILGFNCPEWYYSALGAVAAGGIFAGIYPTNNSEAVKQVLELSGATFCIVDDQKQMDKIHAIKSQLPKLKIVIQINGPFDSTMFGNTHNGYYKWSDIEDLKVKEDCEIEFEKRVKSLLPNECFSLIFTSGTTGIPKGVMLSHDNLISMIRAYCDRLEGIIVGEEVFISYLPLSHIAGQFMDFAIPILVSGCVYFADRDALKGTLVNTLVIARPTRLMSVPRIWEKFHEKLIETEANSNVISSFFFNIAKKMVYNYHTANMNGGMGNVLAYKIGQHITNKVKAELGLDKCRTFITGSAPTNLETKQYLCSVDMLLYDSFGLSETGIISLNDSTQRNLETVGTPLAGTKLKILNPNENGVGEILIQSRSVFMGYLKEPRKTEECFKNDWYRSGDLGRIDANNYLYIVGRIKELLITSGGENIPFLFIEDTIKIELPGISYAIVIGDKKKFLTILVTIKTEVDIETGRPLDKLQLESLQWMQSLNLNYTRLSEILEAGPCPIVMKSIQDGIDRYNKKAISNAQTIKKFSLLPHDFTMITDELGPTLKLKRSFVVEKYKDIINKMYE